MNQNVLYSISLLQATKKTPNFLEVLNCSWWRRTDSNRGHCGYEPHALANWATPPFGADDQDWTGDLILTKDTLCRLSYTSTMNVHFTVKLWLRGQDLNLRPSGYEPDELPTAPPRYKWWREKDSNLRSRRRQIYSLLPLAARESLHK